MSSDIISWGAIHSGTLWVDVWFVDVGSIGVSVGESGTTHENHQLDGLFRR